MHKERLAYLLKQYLDNLITKGELAELLLHLEKEETSTELQTVLEKLIAQTPEAVDYQEEHWEPLYQKVLQASILQEHGGNDVSGGSMKSRRFDRRWMMAAAAVLVLGTGFLWYQQQKVKLTAAAVLLATTHDLAPGTNKATLTLADGTTIDLDAARNGVLGQQGKTRLVKSRDQQLVYQPDGRKEEARYNLLTTPRGGQYQLQLPDGSRVWLNAATSLRYPTSFTGGDRVVELKGEAYFEIAADAKKPFKVKVLKGGALETEPLQVEVLGTHFNIMDYDEEPAIRTTLLEGLVRVSKGGHTVLVRPGEQARLSGSDELRVMAADTEEAIAWKDGMFRFKDAGIGEVMRQLARWYDVEVVYVNGVPRDRFQGEMYRNVNASKILKVLEASGVHFTVEGRKINLFMDKAP
ncbi:MAG TPA: FecR domain-containing protein [Puia sp.]|jgi:ferric-dicitrate binding protein FerR (iron transport regulator)|nr:FecR domain-containing protein [Puia sp.]